jgi:hypothetical protein
MRAFAWIAGVLLFAAMLMLGGCSSNDNGSQGFQDDPNGYVLTISPDNVTLAAGSTQTYTAILTQAGVPVDPQPEVAWSAAPEGTGQFTGNVFAAGAPGQSGTITASVIVNGAPITDTATVAIANQSLALVAVEVGPANDEDLSAIPAGASVQLIAYAINEAGTATPITEPVVWTVTGSIGTVTQNGVFTATEPGTGKVHATYAGFSGFAAVQVLCPSEL